MTPRLCIRRLSRAALLRGTALQAAFALTLVPHYVQPASAQPAPNARPQGGQVVGGSATIARAPGSTTVTQSTDRAAIDWRSFDVGRNQAVTFQQPSATSATLNRVTGPDPSAIAGRISANGQVILTNPNGVTFYRGSQVNAQSLIVSAPGITNQNFMAGKMVFDQASKPGARIENAGTITVKQAGLAALVAPSVANSGTINARLGTVILAGAAAHTLDMYGDGLVSIDVTKQVRQAPVGPGGKPVTALVTNTGTVRADGGTIQLTARAADGVVQTLVDSGGTLQANTVGAKAGQIEIAGTGGAVVIAGRVAADGHKGQAGTIVLNGSTATTLADTAHVTANGRTGGGTVAVGTTLARARTTGPAPAATSAQTTIAAGARVAANATRQGDGGRVTVLSTQSTKMAGTIEAKGGAQAGNGGMVELSGETGFHLTGKVDTRAPHGRGGDVVLDPRDLGVINDETTPPPGSQPIQPSSTDPNIAATTGGTATDSYVTVNQLKQLNAGSIHLLTTRDLTVAASLDTGADLTLEAGRNLTIESPGSIVVPNSLSLKAASNTIAGYDPSGILTIAGTITGPNILLQSGTGGITLMASVNPSNVQQSHEQSAATLHISTPGALTQSAGTVNVPEMYGSAGSVNLGNFNAISGVGSGQNAAFQTTTGGFSLVNAAGNAVTVGNAAGGGGLFAPAGQPIFIAADRVTFNAPTGGKAVTAPGSTLTLQAVASGRAILVSATDNTEGSSLFLTPTELSRLAIDTIQLGTRPGSSSSITLGQSDEAINLTSAGIAGLGLGARDAIKQGGPLTVANLSVASGTSLDLSNTANRIGTLRGLSATGTANITTAGDLTLTGSIGADSATITAGGSITKAATSTLSASNSITLSAGSSGIPGANPAAAITLDGSNQVTKTLTLSAGTGGIALAGSVSANAIATNTTGALTQGASGITAATLSGTADAVNLSSTRNAIASIGNVTVLSGDFRLVDSSPLTIGGPSVTGGIVVPNGKSIGLVTDSLTIQTSSVALDATGGVVVLQPFTTSTPILLTSSTKPTNTLALTTGELRSIRASDLILGGTNPGTGQSNAGGITLGKPGEAIDFTSLGIGALGLNTTGTVVQGGPLAIGTLSANAGSITLVTAGNQIGTTAGVAATGDIALHTDGNLSVGFTQAGGNLSLSSGGQGGMTLFGALRGQTVALNSLNTNASVPTANDPGITQTGGSITASTLTGAAGSAQFGKANAVAGLGDFATYGGLQLNDAGSPLTLTGTISTTTGAVTLTAAGLAQTAGSRLITPELDGTSTATTTLTARGNAVGSIGSFSQTAGDLTLVTNTPTLGIGRVSASTGSLTFVADGIGSAGTASVAGGISAPGGSVTFTPYTAGRRIELIGTSAADPNALSIGAANLSGLSAQRLVLATTGAIGIGNSGETIDLRNAVGTLQLQAGGAVTEGADASLRVGTLSGIAGSLALSSATNGIDAADSLSTTAGALNLRTGGALATGTVTSSAALTLTAGGTVTATGRIGATDVAIDAAAGITQSAGSLVATNSVSLVTPGHAIIQTGGIIQAASLTAAADTLSLPDANVIASASIAATGNVTLSDASSLTLLGLTANSASISTSGSLALGGNVVANDLGLSATGAITQPGGTITAGTLSLASAGRIVLAQANTVANLTSSSSVGGLTLVDTGALSVTNVMSDPTAITLRTSGDLTLAGKLSTGALTLTSGGAITQSGGSIVANTLSTTSASTTSLGQVNAVATLISASSNGGLTIADAGTLVVGGPLTDPTAITLRTGGDLTLSGPITTGNLTFAAGGAITQSAGTISAASIGGTAASATLNQANAIATLADFTTSGSFSLTDASRLTVAGSVTAGSSENPGQTVALTTADLVFGPGGRLIAPGGTVSLAEYTAGQGITLGGGGIPFSADTLIIGSATTGQINITGTFDLSGLTLDLRSGADIVESGAGAIKAAALTGVAGSASLTGRNQIGTLARFTAAGGFTLDNAADLVVSGPVTAANIALSSTGNLALSGTLGTPGALTLRAGGDITQPGGSIAAGSLGGSATNASLGQASNAVAGLSDFLTTGNFSYAASGSLTVGGTVSGRTVAFDLGGGIGEAASGRLVAGLLSGRADSAALTGANQVDAVTFATSNGFALNDARAMTVIGPLTDRASGIALTAPSITLAGSLTAPSLTLTSPGAITQTAGALSVGTLAGSVGGLEIGNQAPASVGTLGALTATSAVTLTDQTSLRVAGPLTAPAFAITAAGSLTLDGGTIRTDGQSLASQLGASPGPGGSSFTVRPGPTGTASLQQLGTTTLTSLSGGTATLRLGLAANGGTLALNDLQAPGGNVVLALGNGAATGKLNVGNLAVLGSGGSANLTGQIGTRSGSTAALGAQLLPGTDLRYTFNSCAIASVSCSSDVFGSITLPTAAIISVLRPDILTLGILDLTVTRDRDDPSLLLPNISDRDY